MRLHRPDGFVPQPSSGPRRLRTPVCPLWSLRSRGFDHRPRNWIRTVPRLHWRARGQSRCVEAWSAFARSEGAGIRCRTAWDLCCISVARNRRQAAGMPGITRKTAQQEATCHFTAGEWPTAQKRRISGENNGSGGGIYRTTLSHCIKEIFGRLSPEIPPPIPPFLVLLRWGAPPMRPTGLRAKPRPEMCI